MSFKASTTQSKKRKISLVYYAKYGTEKVIRHAPWQVQTGDLARLAWP